MNKTIELFKVLGDETRLRITNLIYHHKLCVCELVEILDLSQPKISKHIARLRQIDLVNTERNEQYIYYSMNKEDLFYNNIIEDIMNNLKENETLQKDLEKLNTIESFVCNR